MRTFELVWTRKPVHVRYLVSLFTSQEFYILCLLVFGESSDDWWRPRYIMEVLFLCNKPKTKGSSPLPFHSIVFQEKGLRSPGEEVCFYWFNETWSSTNQVTQIRENRSVPWSAKSTKAQYFHSGEFTCNLNSTSSCCLRARVLHGVKPEILW